MKRGIASLLRGRSSWQLVAIAAVAASVALALIFAASSSTLRTLRPLLILLFGAGGAALILALVRRAEEIAAGAARGWARLLAAIVGLAAAIAFVTYSLAVHRRAAVAACNASVLPDTLAARRAALADAEARLHSPFALLHRLVDDRAARECARSREDLARVDAGLCTRWPLVDQRCRCGDETYPYARCDEPRCLHEPGQPDLFYCVGDDLPPGRSM